MRRMLILAVATAGLSSPALAEPDEFRAKPVWQRIIGVLGGSGRT